jgi:hypothetical protein
MPSIPDRIRTSGPGSRASAFGERHPTLAGPGLLLSLAVLITFLSWPILDRPPTAGLDPSWQIALHLAAWADLRHGVDVVFTYGPLGFLSVPQPYLGGTTLLALIASMAIYLGLVTVLLVEGRRVLPLWAAAVVTLLIARTFVMLPPFEAFQALIFVVCIEALVGRIRLPATATLTLIGVAAGVAALGKLNVGVFVGAMGLVTALAIDRRWWRGLIVYLAAATATALGLWILTGQRLGDLPSFASGAIQIISGYSETMGADRDAGLYWIYLAFGGIALLLAWMTYRVSAGWPNRRRVGLALLCLILGFAMWKTAFVRWYPGYAFATLLVGAAVLGSELRDRRMWLTSLLAVGIAFAGVARLQPIASINVVASARSLVTEAVTAAIPSRAQAAAERNRAALRTRYALDPTTLGELAGRRVHIDPVEAGVAFAYPEMTWAPLPVIQSYSTYTSVLDRLNADRLTSPEAPERILRGVGYNRNPAAWLTLQRGRATLPGESIPDVVDGRFRWFEAPAAMLQTFCRYRELSSIASWQVLGLSGGSCGPAEPLGAVEAAEGVAVQVPVESRPGRFVIVRVHGLEPSLLGRLRTTLYKPGEWYVTVRGVRYRLVTPTASDGLLLAVPPAADGTGEFAFGQPIDSISIAGRQKGKRILTYEFESVPLIRPLSARTSPATPRRPGSGQASARPRRVGRPCGRHSRRVGRARSARPRSRRLRGSTGNSRRPPRRATSRTTRSG